MRAAVTAEMIRVAGDEKVSTMFDELVKKATEDGMVVGSLLKAGLEAAGFSVEVKPGTKHGFWVEIMKDLNTTPSAVPNMGLVAKAFANTETEAIKQAVFAEMRQAAKEAKEAEEALAPVE